MIRSAWFRVTILLLILALAASPALAAGKAPARQNAASLVTQGKGAKLLAATRKQSV